MASHSLLILCGDTYAQRLWCAWEMYVFFTIADQDEWEMDERLRILPLQAAADCNPTDTLAHFQVQDAHCFSSDDEVQIRAIIGGDEARFESAVRDAAAAVLRSS